SAAPNLAEAHWAAEETVGRQKPHAVEPNAESAGPAAVPAKVCEKCGTTYTGGYHACPVDQATLQKAAQTVPATKTEPAYPSNGKNGSNGNGSAAVSPEYLSAMMEAAADAPPEAAVLEAEVDDQPQVGDASRETAEKEFHRLRAIVEQRSQEALPREEEESVGLSLTKTQIIAIVTAFCVLLAIVVTVVVHHYNAKSEAAAAAAAAVKTPPVVPDADMQKQIELRLASLKDSTIEVTVQGGVVTLNGRSPSEEEAVQAEDLALQTNGVKVVRDRLQVDGRGANGKPRAGKTAQR